MKIEQICGKKITYSISDKARSGDHIWYISDIRKFQSHFPEFKYDYNTDRILKEMLDSASAF